MPVWLTFFIALVATAGFFGSIYFIIVALVEGRRTIAKPRFGILPGDAKGQFKVWVTWDTKQFALSVYRIKVTYVSPDQPLKEGNFSVTYESPQKAPFVAAIEAPESFIRYLDQMPKRKALVSYEIRFVENIVLAKTLWGEAFKKVLNGEALSKKKAPKLENMLAVAKTDPPSILSLEYHEMVLRLKKVREMEAAAKAKAAKAAAAKAAAPTATATTPA
jgi:hypothetical protein